MANVAVELGAVEYTGTPAEIPGIVLQALRQRQGRRSRQAARST